MNNPEQEVAEQKVRRAVGISALRKIGVIAAEEQQADALHWFVRYDHIALRSVVACICRGLNIIKEVMCGRNLVGNA